MDETSGAAVLVAEDDFFIGQMLSSQLRELGYRVAGQAADGAEAVRMVSELRPDVVLMDVRMPLVDGLEAARRIQQVQPTAVVVLTAYHNQALLHRAVQAGVGAYIRKPARREDLVCAIEIARGRFQELSRLRAVAGACPEPAGFENAPAADEHGPEGDGSEKIISVCSLCKRALDQATRTWMPLDSYVNQHLGIHFSHTLCPPCVTSLYPDLAEELD